MEFKLNVEVLLVQAEAEMGQDRLLVGDTAERYVNEMSNVELLELIERTRFAITEENE